MPKMRLVVTLALAGAALAGCSAGEDASGSGAEVIAAEAARVAALTSADWVALEPRLADELHYTHSNAWVESKSGFLETVRTGAIRYERMDHDDLAVRVYGKTAVMTGVTSVRVSGSRFPDGAIELPIRFTAVHVFRDGRWQLAAWQSTRVPEPPPE